MAEIETFIIKQQVGMLIIDSIGSITRRQFGQDKSIERGSALCSLSSHLKDVAHTLNIAVVITNHIAEQQLRQHGASYGPVMEPLDQQPH